MAITECSIDFQPELWAHGVAAQSALALASLRAPSADSEHQRSSVSLSLVIDVSGSMAGAKLKLVQATAAFLLDHLLPSDKLSLIAYDSNVRSLLSPVPATRRRSQRACCACKLHSTFFRIAHRACSIASAREERALHPSWMPLHQDSLCPGQR